MTARPKCPDCGHTEHKTPCDRLGPSRCVGSSGPEGVMFICGARPPCGCQRTATHCSCGVLIWWALTERGKLMCIDHGSAGEEAGNLAVVRRAEDGRLACRVLAGPDVSLRGNERHGRPHWSTCPDSDQYRRGRRSA